MSGSGSIMLNPADTYDRKLVAYTNKLLYPRLEVNVSETKRDGLPLITDATLVSNASHFDPLHHVLSSRIQEPASSQLYTLP